jgi:peptidoglycan hydrolase CwlO-like protein
MTDLERAQAEFDSLAAQVARASLKFNMALQKADTLEMDLERLQRKLDEVDETLHLASMESSAR